jgi:hypothetical protein
MDLNGHLPLAIITVHFDSYRRDELLLMENVEEVLANVGAARHKCAVNEAWPAARPSCAMVNTAHRGSDSSNDWTASRIIRAKPGR